MMMSLWLGLEGNVLQPFEEGAFKADLSSMNQGHTIHKNPNHNTYRSNDVNVLFLNVIYIVSLSSLAAWIIHSNISWYWLFSRGGICIILHIQTLDNEFISFIRETKEGQRRERYSFDMRLLVKKGAPFFTNNIDNRFSKFLLKRKSNFYCVRECLTEHIILTKKCH